MPQTPPPDLQLIQAALKRLAGQPGIAGCALVERSSGMVWYHESLRPDMESVAEAAVEFFRSPDRLQFELKQFGELRSVAYSFDQFVLALHPCETSHDLVLVCLADKKAVDWAAAGTEIRSIRGTLQQMHL